MSPTAEDFQAAVLDVLEETAEERAARYERGIRAIVATRLIGPDFGDWVQSQCESLLEGLEAECPECGTVVHEGPCVGEELV
jgi:hypothetical protein